MRQGVPALLLLVLAAAGSRTYRHVRQARLDAELLAAVSTHDLACVKALLGQGADPNARPVARRSGWQAIIEGLLGHGRPLGKPVIAVAADEGRWDVLEAVLRGGANPNVRGEEGWSPLLRVVDGGPAKLVRLLLDRGADPNWQAVDGTTALERSVWSMPRLDVALLLIDRGARVNARDAVGETALMRAATRRDLGSALLLIERGADVNARAADGQTALHGAMNGVEVDSSWSPGEADRRSCAMVRMLLLHGADPTARDREGLVPRGWVAEGPAMPRACRLLLRAEAGWRRTRPPRQGPGGPAAETGHR